MTTRTSVDVGLISSGLTFLGWHSSVLCKLLSRAPLATIAIVAVMVIAEFAQMLSFFLPLKILILLGTEGVPRYFQAFMTEESRTTWIIILCVMTVVFSVLSIVMRFSAKRIGNIGATSLVGRLGKDRREAKGMWRKAHRAYTKTCRSYADLAIASLGIFVIILIYPSIAAVMIALFILELLLTHALLSSSDNSVVKWISIRIKRSSQMYLKYLATLNFLVLFFLLVTAYLIGDEREIVPAILVLLLGRRSFPALTRYIKQAIRQYPQRDRLSLQLFPI